jgi:hypothetical protein
MKNYKKVLIAACCFVSANAFSQIKVDTYGDVFVGSTTITPFDTQGDLIIGQDNQDNSLTFYNGTTGTSMRMYRMNDMGFIVRGRIPTGATYNTAGLIMDINGNIGIKKTPTTTFALDINGPIRAGTPTWITSDKRCKSNIKPIKLVNNAFDSLTPYSYNYKRKNIKLSGSDKEEFTETLIDSVDSRQSFGFLAQDVQKFYPDLVMADENGLLSVSYEGFIPILWQANKDFKQTIVIQQKKINELQEQIKRIDELEFMVNSCCSKSNGKSKLKSGTISTENSNTLDEALSSNALAQNYPNPWNNSTEIGVTLNSSVKTATICIYDLTGKQIRCYQVTARGETSITIHAEELQPGLYLYSLLADGKLVDTKKMVLTE